MRGFVKSIYAAAVLLTAFGFVACDDDPPLPDNIIEFQSDAVGFAANEQEINLNLTLSRIVDEGTPVTLALELTDLAYGTDFTTEPAAVNNTLTLSVVNQATTLTFKVKKNTNVVLDGDEKAKFTIESAGDDLIIGAKDSVIVSFAEIVSTQATMDPNVGGALQPNRVFIDLSANRQTARNRGEWDLGLYTVSGQYRVILNSSTGMLAYPLTKTTLTEVVAADTVGLGARVDTDAIFTAINSPTPPSWVTTSVAWMDNPTGDITKTAFAEVAASEADNKVYIVNRGKNPDGTRRGWKKVRVIRNGTGYTVQHADISASTFQTIQVTRNDAYLFNYVNFATNNVVEIEPRKEQWDIAFTVFTNTFPLSSTNPAAGVIPYVFFDVVLQNRYNVETAQVLSSTISYENFAESNLSGITFSTSQLGIGSSWRGIVPQTGQTSLRTDRFYLVRDAGQDIYKLRFTAFTQNGERGRPRIEYALVRRGN